MANTNTSKYIFFNLCCYKKDSKNPVNIAYAEIVFEILKRTSMKKDDLARDVTAKL